MWRSRLLWFTFGFASTYGVVSQCVLKEYYLRHHALTSHMNNQFGALQARLSHIDTNSPNPPSVPAPTTPDQVEG